ncbi:MAG: DUF3306 domain-containing protein [Candidatus Competibacterales bacterium]
MSRPSDPDPDAEGAPEGFLRRWSARKAEARRSQPLGEVETPDLLQPEANPGETAVSAPPDSAPAVPWEKITDRDLPDPATLGEGADYRAYLAPKVSAALRRAALRRLFHLPQFNVTDGLDDYAEDFTQFAPLGDVVTWDMRHRASQLEDTADAEVTPNASIPEGEVAAEADRDRDRDQERPEVVAAEGEGPPTPGEDPADAPADSPADLRVAHPSTDAPGDPGAVT